MKGRNPNTIEKVFHDLLAREIGCIACYIDSGRSQRSFPVSIHHIDGRTKAHAHWLVLPLCAGHHQDGYGRPGMVAVHPWKKRFELMYAPQRALLADCITQLIEQGYDLPEQALELAA